MSMHAALWCIQPNHVIFAAKKKREQQQQQQQLDD
jgi:hypothetical protein